MHSGEMRLFSVIQNWPERLLGLPWKGKSGCYADFFYFKWTQAAMKAFRQYIAHLARGLPELALVHYVLSLISDAWFSGRMLSVPRWSWFLIALFRECCAFLHRLSFSHCRVVPGPGESRVVQNGIQQEEIWASDRLCVHIISLIYLAVWHN